MARIRSSTGGADVCESAREAKAFNINAVARIARAADAAFLTSPRSLRGEVGATRRVRGQALRLPINEPLGSHIRASRSGIFRRFIRSRKYIIQLRYCYDP